MEESFTPTEVSLSIRATFDDAHEAVGLVAEASHAFDEGDNTRAKIEVLAAITAKANAVAAEIIRTWTTSDPQRQQLYDHYSSLKERMLTDMLKQMDKPPGQ